MAHDHLSHPSKKLGRRPNDPDKPRLRLANHLNAAALPTAPIASPAPDLVWPMDHNDEWGCCVVAAADHFLQAVCSAFGIERDNWSTEQIVTYYRTQNPNFDPAHYRERDDQGMVVQDFLAHLVKEGVILGFAEVDPSNEAEVEAATYLGLGVVTGEDLQVAQQDQQVWSYVKGSPSWGGHATVTAGYLESPDHDQVVTWGELVEVTQSFVRRLVSEAWFVITQAHVDNASFREGFDLRSFAQAYEAITGRPFPVEVPDPAPEPEPEPTPEPTPTPTPDPGPPPAPEPDPSIGDEIEAVIAAIRRFLTWLVGRR